MSKLYPAKQTNINSSKKKSKKKQSLGGIIIRYFFQGLLILAPIVLTFYLIFFLLAFLDRLIPIPIPGVGLLIILGFITGIGFLSSTFLFKPFFQFLQQILLRVPLVKIIYTALQDLFSAFVSDKKKFETPVLVYVNKESGIKRLGFITQDDMDDFETVNEVAVYCPHSYNFSGDLFIVPKENVTLLENISSTDAMKFIVSGGIAGLESQREEDNTETDTKAAISNPEK